MIDNFDSFTYNLVQILRTMTDSIMVRRNNEVTVGEIEQMNPSRILLSPGPGHPEEAGVTLQAITRCGSERPVLGICLGHQAIGLAFGAKIVHAPVLFHGKTSMIHHDARGVFTGIANPFPATRYHSLVVSTEEFPPDLEITARTKEGVIMGIRHRKYPVEGVQFHPESILTIEGERLIRNWMDGK